MTTQSYSKQHKERPDLGPCPKCAAAGYEARLRLYKGKTKGDNPRSYEFAACEMGKEACGYTQAAKGGKLIALTYCTECQQRLLSKNLIQIRDIRAKCVFESHYKALFKSRETKPSVYAVIDSRRENRRLFTILKK